MEEEIKVLENCWVMTTKHVLDEGNIALKLAIKNIIKGYKQLEEENKELLEVKISASAHNRIMELEEENKQLEAIKDEAIRRYNFESIPVSKVKEKIEEIKLSLKDDCLALHEFQRLAKIDVLEELLREE